MKPPGCGTGPVSAMTPNSEPLVGVQHATSIKLDDDAKHVVVQQQVGSLFQSCYQPRKKERIGAQARKYAEILRPEWTPLFRR